ncbi:hypothetical protein ACHAP5_009473 [Fusarium lateritium]
MSAPRTRQYRRVAQACDNCRRKKIRCPGERPRCSACTRLRQACSFSDSRHLSEDSARTVETRMSSRLEQLEDKLDSVINRLGISTSSDTVNRAIEFYFRHIHRQPLWLFDEHSLPNPDTSEGLICAILAINAIYRATEFGEDDSQSPDVYSKTARTGVMLKIAEGNVTIQSTQTLCLLAYFNFREMLLWLASTSRWRGI